MVFILISQTSLYLFQRCINWDRLVPASVHDCNKTPLGRSTEQATNQAAASSAQHCSTPRAITSNGEQETQQAGRKQRSTSLHSTSNTQQRKTKGANNRAGGKQGTTPLVTTSHVQQVAACIAMFYSTRVTSLNMNINQASNKSGSCKQSTALSHPTPRAK